MRKAAGAHHRGHEDAPTGGDRLNRRGEVRLKTCPLHHGDGEGARDDDIGRAAPADHAHQPARNDGGLRRTALQVPDEGEGELYEDISHLRHLKKHAEHDEKKDVACIHASDDAEDSLRPEEEGHDFVEREARVLQPSRNEVAVDGVKAEEDAQYGEHPAKHAAAHLDGDHKGEEPHDHVMPFDNASPLPPVGEVQDIVDKHHQSNDEENDIHRGGPVAGRTLPGGVAEKRKDGGEEDVEAEVGMECVEISGKET